MRGNLRNAVGMSVIESDLVDWSVCAISGCPSGPHGLPPPALPGDSVIKWTVPTGHCPLDAIGGFILEGIRKPVGSFRKTLSLLSRDSEEAAPAQASS